MKKILSLLVLFCTLYIYGNDYYWVGGSGNWTDINHWRTSSGGTALPSVIPGPTDNVFFDANSGFTSTSKTITLDNTANCHNITFSGSAVAPTLSQSGSQTLNIYGSSEWQTGMSNINVYNIYYRHTGEAKTIKSNGVKTGLTSGRLYFEEENSISLLDDFEVLAYYFYQNAGTWNTNNHQVTIASTFMTNYGSNKPTTLNLGSSIVYLNATYSVFTTNSALTKVNAGTSHLYFTKSNITSFGYGLSAHASQSYFDVTFQSTGGVISGGAKYNRVEFKGDGSMYGNNTFKDLLFTAGKTYTLEVARTQTIENWTLGGTPCDVTFVQSSTPGSRANVDVTAANTKFNFGNLKDINASGKTLHFAEQSTIANQNNNNITYDPYNPGSFDGLGPDWINHRINNADSSTYMLTTNGFYGNMYTTYKWYKLNDSRYDPNISISMSKDIDIRDFGEGTYRVEVSYSDGQNITCVVPEEIFIKLLYISRVYVNPNLRMRVK